MRQFAGHHRLNGHECEQTPGDSERYGLLQSRGCKELVGHDWEAKTPPPAQKQVLSPSMCYRLKTAKLREVR